MAEIKLNIDGRDVTGMAGQTILDIATENGINIPTFCHDERIEVFGSCGLCIVEVEGNPKLFRSCATNAADGMIVHTRSERIDNNRKAALELLLSDHTGDCRPPCMLACPGQTDCQGYVGLIANGAYNEAYKLIKDKIPLPASIGRVCPHPCEEACRRSLVEDPVSIAALKQFAADVQHDKGSIFTAEVPSETGKKIAVIGGGPGGLSAAYFLRAKGHSVTVYEAMPLMGGMLRYGIPEYRLPKKVLQEEIDTIENMGVVYKTGVRIGKDITLDKLQKENDAVVIAIGAWSSTGMNCPGEDLEGVHGGIEFLWNISGISETLLRRRVAIVGGGNTAMDACRTAVRSGASVVYNIYRRTRNEMPAEESEIDEAEEEGVIFKNLTNPIEIIGKDGKVSSMRLQLMELGEPDASGRRSPVPIKGAEESIDVDIVIMAIGQKPDIAGFDGINASRWDTIIADESTFLTNSDGVFAIGDATNKGADIAITAIGEAKRASDMIDRYLKGEVLEYNEPFLVKSEKTEDDFMDKEKVSRVRMPHRSPADRKKDFLEINYGFSEDEAIKEASRCLECGCMDFFECKLVKYAGEYAVQPERFTGLVHTRIHTDIHPHIRRNADKCILCGSCVRICEQVSGATSIGFMERGFDTIVKPAFERDLSETDCTSCGQCVFVCPTGALSEVQFINKQTPLSETFTETVCSFCSAGCKVRIGANGTVVTRAIPSSEKGSLLCNRGRFNLKEVLDIERINTSLIRYGTGLEQADMKQAVQKVNASFEKLNSQYGDNCIAVSISSNYTNEEAQVIKEYAEKVLKTNLVFSLEQKTGGLIDVTGTDVSTGKLSDIESSDLIFIVAPAAETYKSVAVMRARKAVRHGAKLILISSMSDENSYLLDDIATIKIEAGDLLGLEQIAKCLVELKSKEKIEGLSELSESLAKVKAGDDAESIAGMLAEAKKAVFIFERNIITAQAARLIADIAVLSGHADGIIQLLPGPNSQGLINLGIMPGETLCSMSEKGKIKGLFIFGDDIKGINLSSVEFLAVQDLYISNAARQADVVFPSASYIEKDGSYTSADNTVRTLNRIIPDKTVTDGISLVKELSLEAGVKLPDKKADGKKPESGKIKLVAAKKDSLYREN